MRESATPVMVRAKDRGSTTPSTERCPVGRSTTIRILVVFESHYLSYREAIAGALRSLRPQAEVAVADLGALEAEIKNMAPDLVICSQINARNACDVLAWVEIPCDPEQPARICLKGRCSETINLTLDELLLTVDETEALAHDVSRRDIPQRTCYGEP
jgi:hypothetical protein